MREKGGGGGGAGLVVPLPSFVCARSMRKEAGTRKNTSYHGACGNHSHTHHKEERGKTNVFLKANLRFFFFSILQDVPL
ncbi:hypothetical protein TRSC58_07594 [Trypanosoma rangeli SC58]|uniref:Uncharacterized protein n=1 Tax=Trypanosoma rangeli SC58 TaxID=429131 RepID=A0A061ISV5_TRYRA|nr:hypothetical protein TRSC58_07594 [Trypanosoma rangeli SC58]